MKVNTVQTKSGTGRDGRPWTRYDVTLEGGMQASGFDPVQVGEDVELIQKGKFLNFQKPGSAIQKPKFMGSESLFTKDDYYVRKEKRDIEWQERQIAQQPRIERQHSQQMALMYYQITGKMPENWGEFRDKVSQFQRDIGTSPVPIPVQKDIQGLYEIPQPELPTELPTDHQDEIAY